MKLRELRQIIREEIQDQLLPSKVAGQNWQKELVNHIENSLEIVNRIKEEGDVYEKTLLDKILLNYNLGQWGDF